jgi:hypothetical protein
LTGRMERGVQSILGRGPTHAKSILIALVAGLVLLNALLTGLPTGLISPPRGQEVQDILAFNPGLNCSGILSIDDINNSVGNAYASFNSTQNSSNRTYPVKAAVSAKIESMWSIVCNNSTFVTLYNARAGTAHPSNFSFQEAFGRASGITVVSFVLQWFGPCVKPSNAQYGTCSEVEGWDGWILNDTVSGPYSSESRAIISGPVPPSPPAQGSRSWPLPVWSLLLASLAVGLALGSAALRSNKRPPPQEEPISPNKDTRPESSAAGSNRTPATYAEGGKIDTEDPLQDIV